MSLCNELYWRKRLMRRSSNRKSRQRRRARRKRGQRVTFTQALRHFLTPQVWKQAHQAWQRPHYQSRWCLKALIEILLLMTWGLGQSQGERFQTARASYVGRHPHNKRPGETEEGFQKALRRLPLRVFRALAAGVRQRIGQHWLERLRIAGYIPIACDGTRLECPRSAALETRLGQAGKNGAAPSVYLSTLVLLPLGLLWSWRIGKGTASEHEHLSQLLPTLPERSLLVCDAGYLSYELYWRILRAPAAFLVRMSSRAYLYTQAKAPLERFREGWVYYWPAYAQRRRRPPIRARLLRVRGEKADVWLLTSLGPDTLSARQVAQIYRWRWRNEGLFRSYKRGLDKVKLRHRTVALVHREAEGSLLALQLLLATTVWQQRATGGSPRRMLLQIRGEVTVGIAQLGPRQSRRYVQTLQEIHGEAPHRTSTKIRRRWPRKKRTKPPGPPHLRRLTERLKTLMAKTLNAA
jgi:Transposase DDE domain